MTGDFSGLFEGMTTEEVNTYMKGFEPLRQELRRMLNMTNSNNDPKPEVKVGQIWKDSNGNKYKVVWTGTTPEPCIRIEFIENNDTELVGMTVEYTEQHIPVFFKDFTLLSTNTKKKDTPLFQVDFDRDNPSEDYDDAFDTIKRMIDGSQ